MKFASHERASELFGVPEWYELLFWPRSRNRFITFCINKYDYYLVYKTKKPATQTKYRYLFIHSSVWAASGVRESGIKKGRHMQTHSPRWLFASSAARGRDEKREVVKEDEEKLTSFGSCLLGTVMSPLESACMLRKCDGRWRKKVFGK